MTQVKYLERHNSWDDCDSSPDGILLSTLFVGNYQLGTRFFGLITEWVCESAETVLFTYTTVSNLHLINVFTLAYIFSILAMYFSRLLLFDYENFKIWPKEMVWG